ncbi:MAG TPA: acylglycerol kinase family protein, partial [Chitinophagales bacterium]|nr:acylglycerol kinase family protein [Chitinophagales bacterium]
MKIAFLLNATIRKKEKVIAEVKQTFSKHEIEFFESEYAGHFFSLPQLILDKGFSILIVIGGDGTLNEVINGLIQACKLSADSIDWKRIATIKIGVYAAGSGNDFIKTVYKDNQLYSLKKLIENESSQLIDIGYVTFFDPSNNPASRYYMNITDVGMGGEAVMLK